MCGKNTVKAKRFLLLGLLCALFLWQGQRVQAQTVFLISPYFGTEAISQDYHTNHHAIDFGLSYERVLAAESGTVYHVEWYNDNCHHFWNHPDNGGDILNCGYGLHARIDHGNNYRTYYAHLSTVAFNLGAANETVKPAQIIGTSGNTGYSSDPHLHFQTQHRINNIWTNVNPFDENNISLWEDGQWANPSTPIPEPPTNDEKIVDDNTNNSNGFTKGRGAPFNISCPPNNCPAWNHSTTTGYNGDMYHTPTQLNDDDYWAKWQPSHFPHGGGLYEIEVYVPANNATTWRARYTIIHTTGTSSTTQTTAVVDQEGTDNRWVSLGIYTLKSGDYVYTTSATNENNEQLAVDAVRFTRIGTNYTPLYNYVSGSWTTKHVIRNNGGPAQVRQVFYNSNGTRRCVRTIDLERNESHRWHTCPSASSVVVDATQDISVSTILEHSSPYAASAYSSPEDAATNLFVPLVHRNNGGQYTYWNSEISIHNAGTQTATITIQFMPGTAGSSCTQTNSVAPNGTWQLNTSNLSCLGSMFIGSARVTASVPLAVADLQYKTAYGSVYKSIIGSSSIMLPSGALQAPLVQNNNAGWTSGLTLQNATGSSHTVGARYYRLSGSSCRYDTYSIGGYNLAVQYPAPPAGSCSSNPVLSTKFTSIGNINAQVNQIHAYLDSASGYPAVTSPTSRAIIPYAVRNSTWDTGIQIRNASSYSASVKVTYYNSNGVVVGSPITYSVAGNGAVTIYPITPPASFYGSAVVESTNGRDIAVVVNHLRSGSGDTLMSHIAPNR